MTAPSAVGAFIDQRIESLRNTSGMLREEAARDHLTGLLNRRGLIEAVDQLSLADPRAVIYLDLDGFKEVNDQAGHQHGDAVLVEVGRRLREQTRSKDLVARLGGDEFLLVIEAPERGILGFTRRLERTVSEPIAFEGRTHTVGCSLGFTWLTEGDELDAVIHRADIEMFRVKGSRRGGTREPRNRTTGPSSGPASQKG
jgi:diguanylate cyclase (GGDEF)-like protein